MKGEKKRKKKGEEKGKSIYFVESKVIVIFYYILPIFTRSKKVSFILGQSTEFSYTTMTIQIVPLTESDIPGAVECIQQAFADDPYYHWVFDSSKVCMVGVGSQNARRKGETEV